ncbi:MAG: S8 family serine peptidase [Bacteroidales bacterium]|nr:S8 family serine peptidase [Bacteroidales bacterium]
MKKIYSAGRLPGFIIIFNFMLLSLYSIAGIENESVIRGERPPIDILTVPDEALEKGIIRIKFNRSQEMFLDQTSPSAGPGGIIQFGIPAIDQLNVQFGVTAVQKSFNAALQNTKFTERHRQWGFHLWYDLIVPEGVDVRNMVLTYSAFTEIAFSEPVYKKHLIGADLNNISTPSNPSGGTSLNYTPNDPRYNEQWHYNNTGQQSGTTDADIDLPEAWDITRGNNNVIVAIIDQGIEYTHPDLAANMWPGIGYNFVDNNSTIVPGDHGTHVGGTIAANTNNSAGVSGIAGGDGSGNGVRLMSCQVFIGSSGGSGFHTASIWAADNGASVSQNSWGYNSAGFYEQVVLDAIDYFNSNGGGSVLTGGITIYAAGNSNGSGNYYPGYYSGTLAVAATNNNDQKSWYSNFGNWVDISAPGGETNTVAARGVLSCLTSGSYGFYQGTSMACPHVSGVASLIISLLPGVLTSAELRDILVNTTDNIELLNPDYASLMGSGRLNAYQALLMAQQYIIPTAAFSASSVNSCTGSSVTFTDQTLAPVTSWSWSFPGGSPSIFSGQTPPPVYYAANGLYDVSLTVSDGITTDTETKSAYIEISPVIANFSANTTTVIEGGTVIFSDLSDCSPETWVWSFPGGTPSSYSGQIPPPVVYTSSGNYDVSLTVTKAGDTDTKTATSYIKVELPFFNMTNGSFTICNGQFFDSGGSTGYYANDEDLTITFYPASSGASIELNFTSFNIELDYDYMFIYNGTSIADPLIGTYTGNASPGTVVANNSAGALTIRFLSDYVVTTSGWSANIICNNAAPLADFTSTNTTPTVGEIITLLDLSSNSPSAWLWNISPATSNFLNGTDQSSQNPQVQFLAEGYYTISLTATNSSGSNSLTRTDYIEVSVAASCIPEYSTGSSSGDFISLVQLEEINNSSGATPSPSYTDYSTLTANLTKGASYTITLVAGTYTEGNNISVWIDYNQNNLFDLSEKLGNVTLTASPSAGTISFIVPQTAITGTARMRVREVWAISDIDPCAFYSYGETEDYRVQISPVNYCEPSYSSGTGSGDYISLVQLQEIDNATGPSSSPYYTYYDAVTAELTQGTEYSLTLSAGTYTEGNNMMAWIDFDGDGNFEETENLGFLSLPSLPDIGVITFTVPVSANPGLSRLRVREVYFYTDFGPCDAATYGETEDYPVNISNAIKSLQLNVFLEGLYTTAGMMSQANNEFGPQFGPGIADQVTLEFHNETDYSIIEHSVSNVDLSTNGQLNLEIPGTLTGTYYVTIRHRNSIETTTATPVSFAGTATNYSFDNPSKAYGNNLVLKADGNYALYSGDISQDGIVDGSDMAAVDNASTIVLTGYVAEDTNGDGLVDGSDMALIDNNATMAITAILP